VDTHRGELICYATQRGCTYADAEDLVQEVWLKLARAGRIAELAALPTGEQIGKLKMRLRSEMIDAHRARRCERRGRGAVHEPLHDLVRPPATHDTPRDALSRAELRVALTGCEHLDEQERGTMTPTQRKALYRARQAMRPALRSGGIDTRVAAMKAAAQLLCLATLALCCLSGCGPSAEEIRREAERNAEVSRSLMKSEHTWGTSGSMTGPGNH